MVNKLPLTPQPWRTPFIIANCPRAAPACSTEVMEPLYIPRRKRHRTSGTPARSNSRKIHLWSTLGYAQENR